MTAGRWRTPLAVLVCGGVILSLSLGVRHSFGLFLQPMSNDHGWGRETFALAIAVQNLIWGLAQPLSGMVADRFGAGRVLLAGTAAYALGLVLMSNAATPAELTLSTGVLIGLGLSGTTFSVVYAVIGRSFPEDKRSMALGIAGAAGSFGQFIMLPYGQLLIARHGWMSSLLVLAMTIALMAPLASALGGRPAVTAGPARQSIREALEEAARHRGFWLLTFGFLVCGFQLVFIAIHLPAFLLDSGLKPEHGMMALALVGLFNIFGTYLCGLLGGRFRKKYLLSLLYVLRALAIALFLWLPITPASVYLFAAMLGLLWLGTVPLTSGLVAQIFGVHYLATLFGIVFLGHQLGSFIGVWIGGYLFDLTGSYQVAWIFTIGLGFLAALLHWPIDDRAVQRGAVQSQPA